MKATGCLLRHGGSRLVAAGDLKRLNVGRRGHLSFEDGGVERPLHLRHQPLNICQPGRALRTTPRARGDRLCPTRSRPQCNAPHTPQPGSMGSAVDARTAGCCLEVAASAMNLFRS